MAKGKFFSLIGYVIVIITIFVFAMSIFQRVPSNSSYTIYEKDNLYINTISDSYSDIMVKSTSYQSTMRNFTIGDNIALYDTSALPLTSEYDDYTFMPHFTQTVVIAVDREQTEEVIDSFSDLLDTNQQINFDFGNSVAPNMWEYPQTHQIVLAMAKGLYGEYDVEAIAKDFALIEAQGRFFTGNMSKPIIVTTDSTAVNLIKNGRNLQIIIPSEGSLSFDFGAMIYNDSICFSDNLKDKLMENGYRLPDGSCDNKYYPSAEQYSNTAYVEDIEEYNLATTLVSKTLRRDTFNTRLYGFTNSIETTAFFLPLLFIIISYMISIIRRITNVKIRTYIFYALLLGIFFITIGLLKSITGSSAILETTLWYLYYVPILFMPALLVNVALRVGTVNISPKIISAYKVYFVLTFIPLILVFTNNFHNFVFIVHDYISSSFTHNTGYWFVMGWVAVSVIFAYGLLVYKNITNPRKGAFIYPAVITIGFVSYVLLRSAGFTPFLEFDLTFTMTIMAILYIESCIQSRLFPTNKGYARFFKHSNLAMEITDNKDNPVYKSIVTKDVNENFIKRSSEITGGKFYYFEDYTSINTAEVKLLAVNEEIKVNNKFLLENSEVKANLASLSAEKSVYDSIDQILIIGTEKIKGYIEDIAKGGDKKSLMTAINLCATTMKRDSMYRINALYEDSQPVSILISSFEEVKELIDSNQLSITIDCRISDNLSTENMAVIYSFFTYALERCKEKEASSVLFQIYENAGEIIFSLLANKPLYDNDNFPPLPKYNTHYRLISKQWEDSQVYLLSFTKEAEND